MCIFLRNAFNDTVVSVAANFGAAELTIEATVGNITVIKDECTSAHNAALGGGGGGRPSGILEEVAIVAGYPYAAPFFSKSKPYVGVRASFAVDMVRRV